MSQISQSPIPYSQLPLHSLHSTILISILVYVHLGEGGFIEEGGLSHPLVGHDRPIGSVEAKEDHGQEDPRSFLHVGRVLMALGALRLLEGVDGLEADDVVK